MLKIINDCLTWSGTILYSCSAAAIWQLRDSKGLMTNVQSLGPSLVTPCYCRLGDLLSFLFVSLFVYYCVCICVFCCLRCLIFSLQISVQYFDTVGGTAAVAPPPFRPGNPALCMSRPLVTPYYCRLGDLLCFICVSFIRLLFCMCMHMCILCFLCVVWIFFFSFLLQYFVTVGWVF